MFLRAGAGGVQEGRRRGAGGESAIVLLRPEPSLNKHHLLRAVKVPSHGHTALAAPHLRTLLTGNMIVDTAPEVFPGSPRTLALMSAGVSQCAAV